MPPGSDRYRRFRPRPDLPPMMHRPISLTVPASHAPAPVARQRRFSGGRGSRGQLLARVETYDAGEGAAQDGRAILVRNPGEVLGDALVAAAEGPLGVRVVVAPHDRRQPGDVPGLDSHRIVRELHVDLALQVLAGLQRPRPFRVDSEQAAHVRLVVRRAGVVPEAEPPVGVLADPGTPRPVYEPDVRHQPPRAELDQIEVQAGEPLAGTAADELGDDALRAGRSGI